MDVVVVDAAHGPGQGGDDDRSDAVRYRDALKFGSSYPRLWINQVSVPPSVRKRRSVSCGSAGRSISIYHVGDEGDQLTGEMTAFGGAWDAPVWAAASAAGQAWDDQAYASGDNTWTGGTWSGDSWA